MDERMDPMQVSEQLPEGKQLATLWARIIAYASVRSCCIGCAIQMRSADTVYHNISPLRAGYDFKQLLGMEIIR